MEQVANMQVVTAATFIEEELVEMHQSFGGWSQFDDQRGKFEDPKPYINLEAILREYVPPNLGIDLSDCSWETLFETVSASQKQWNSTEQDARNIFTKVWIMVGERRDLIDPWVDLIPDSHGLSVVKAGIWVVLKLAERSADKRHKIFNTFNGIRTVIVETKYKRRSFQTDPDVAICVRDLYCAVVEAIESLLSALPTKRPFEPVLNGRKQSVQSATHGFVSKFSRKHDHEDPEKGLKGVQDCAKALQLAVDRCRDEKIEAIEQFSRQTHREVGVVRWDQKQIELNTREIRTHVHDVKETIEGIADGVDQVHGVAKRAENVIQSLSFDFKKMEVELQEKGKRDDEIIQLIKEQEEKRRRVAEIQLALMDDSLQAKNWMLEFLMEDRKQKQRLITQLQHQLLDTELGKSRGQDQRSRGVVDLSRLFAILAQSPSNKGQLPDYEATFGHPNNDLEWILGKRGEFNTKDQSQAQSVLQHGRFLKWMNQGHPDFLVVDGNLRSCTLNNISPMSLFCATFALGITKVQPQEVVTQFFCGMHTAPRKDPWAEPNGLVRSLIVQLLMALQQRELLSIDFIDSRSYLRNLEKHDLETLGNTLHRLVCQFPVNTTVYCIIDGVSCFDKDLYGTFKELELVLDWLRYIVQDDSLRTRFKVLMTNPDKCTKRFRQRLDNTYHITLSTSYLRPLMISSRSVEAGISQPLSHSTSPCRSVSSTRELEYDNEDDFWYR